MAGCGKMILGSDSHTRYGALGTMAVGEGGPELVKQLLNNTYDIAQPQVVLVWLTGAPRHGVGPTTWPLPCEGHVLPAALSKTRCWSSPVPAWPACPWTSATASTS